MAKNKSPAAVALGKLRWANTTAVQRSEHCRKASKARTKESYEIATAKANETRRKKKELKWRPKVLNKWKAVQAAQKKKPAKEKSKLYGRRVSLFAQQPGRGWESICDTAIDKHGHLINVPLGLTLEQIDLAEKWIAANNLGGQRIKDGIGFKMIIQPKK